MKYNKLIYETCDYYHFIGKPAALSLFFNIYRHFNTELYNDGSLRF